MSKRVTRSFTAEPRWVGNVEVSWERKGAVAFLTQQCGELDIFIQIQLEEQRRNRDLLSASVSSLWLVNESVEKKSRLI